jgi:hypothetical protein
MLFVGVMDDYPNADSAHWFSEEVFWLLRRRVQTQELPIVRNPTAAS